jgi:N-acetylneuraminic acid mutarotase
MRALSISVLVMLAASVVPRLATCQEPALSVGGASVRFAELPKGIASFGAAEADGFAYVYSGHTGKTHVYSRESVLPGFFRISLTNGGEWEPLPIERPAQGVALVSYGKKLLRFGGMHALNESQRPHDLYSLCDAAEFDPSTNRWRRLVSLPEPRSSHRAAILNDKVYVFGGWSLNGGEDGTWLDHGLVLDLKDENAGWSAVSQPANRRAIEVISFQDQVWMIGGLTPDGEVSKDIWIFDPSTNQWSEGPDVPGMPANGNGIAAAIVHERLVLAGMDGKVYRLSDDKDRWNSIGKLPSSRIHHRLIGYQDQLIVIGGDSRQGHLNTAEFAAISLAD